MNSGEVSPRVFAGLSSLQTLALKSNKLGKLSSDMLSDLFAGLSNLETLDLAYNDIDAVPAGLFQDLRNLQVLSMTTNRF